MLELLGDDPEDAPREIHSGKLALRPPLTTTLFEASLEAIETTATAAAARLERQLAAALSDTDATVDLEYDLGGSFAIDHMRQVTVQAALTVEDLVRSESADALRDIDTVDEAERAVDELFDRLVADQAVGLATAQTRTAARFASQALAESTDVVSGKRWVHTDACPCPGHAPLDGTVIPVEDHFVVEPTDDDPFDYPSSVYVIGDDRPTDCRCFQRTVLADDLPTEPAELAAFETVTVTEEGEPVDALTPRKIELKREHARDGETFLEMFDRVLDSHSVSAAARTLGTSKKTIYKWRDQFAEDLRHYTSR